MLYFCIACPPLIYFPSPYIFPCVSLILALDGVGFVILFVPFCFFSLLFPFLFFLFPDPSLLVLDGGFALLRT